MCPEFPPPLGPPLQTYIPTLMGVRFFEIAIPLVPAWWVPLGWGIDDLFNTAFAIDPPIKGCWVKLTLCGK